MWNEKPSRTAFDIRKQIYITNAICKINGIREMGELGGSSNVEEKYESVVRSNYFFITRKYSIIL